MSKLEGTSMMQTCLNVNVHVVIITDICWDLRECLWIAWYSTNQCAQHKLKIIYTTWQQKHSVKHFLNQIFGFSWYSTRKDLSIDVSITTVGLILTKLRWFQLFSTSQKFKSKFNFDLFWKEIKFLGLYAVEEYAVLQSEDLSIDVSITNVGLILTKQRWFLFSGYGQTNRQTRFWNPHMETCRYTKNLNWKLKIRS